MPNPALNAFTGFEDQTCATCEHHGGTGTDKRGQVFVNCAKLRMEFYGRHGCRHWTRSPGLDDDQPADQPSA